MGIQLKTVMAAFEKEMSIAASDNHCIESAYEETMSMFKDEFPEFSLDFQRRFDEGPEF